MTARALEDLATLDRAGRPLFRVAAGVGGELILCRPTAALGEGMRELDVAERMRLAELSAERPALVVESEHGDYVVVIDDSIDLGRHVPLGPADAELLVRSAARARFGRRDDDVLTLTPWAEEDEVVLVDLDAPEFSDTPVVGREADGTLIWHRGGVDDWLVEAVRHELERLAAEPDTRFGVLTNPLGECICVPDGASLLPHEDIRHQTLMGTAGLLEGAGTLAGAAARLRLLADQMAAAEGAGWRLAQPISDGIGFMERAREGS